jgi:hypothetical protein
MKRLAVAVFVVLLAVGVAPAVAAPPPTDRPLTSPSIAAAIEAAAEFWGQPAATVAVFAATIDELERFTGVANVTATATVDGRIWLLDVAADPRTVEDRIAVCDVVAHELGHALGYGHSADRGSVMWESQRADRAVYECWRKFTPLASLRRWQLPTSRCGGMCARRAARGAAARPLWLKQPIDAGVSS